MIRSSIVLTLFSEISHSFKFSISRPHIKSFLFSSLGDDEPQDALEWAKKNDAQWLVSILGDSVDDSVISAPTPNIEKSLPLENFIENNTNEEEILIQEQPQESGTKKDTTMYDSSKLNTSSLSMKDA